MVDDKGAQDIVQVRNELRLELEDGYAECMGDGLFILFKEVAGETHTLVITPSDLAAMCGAS